MSPPAKLGIGTAALGAAYGINAEAVSRATAVSILKDAITAGMSYVDTASAYGDAESVVGEAVARIGPSRVRICTKLAVSTASGDAARDALNASLERLGIETVDTLMLHSVGTRDLERPEIAQSLVGLRGSGAVRQLGASTYGPSDARAAVALPWCRAVQVEHSILNQSVVRALGDHPRECEVVVRSVLCKGLLTGRRHAVAAISAGLEPDLRALESLAMDLGCSLPELAIRFALDTPGVDIVLVGISSTEELELALRAAERARLTAEQLSLLSSFDRSHSDATHPERWQAMAGAGAR